MASSGSKDCYSQLNDSIDKSKSKIHSSEHEETLKADQMATKKFDEEAHIEDLNETQLKSLLDEAMDYKSPRDANDKSDTFKQLLKNVTEEDMKSERFSLGNYGLKQSNSLQNLLDDSHYQMNSHQSHQSGKKHHQKNRKNSTSVSARRLEGGSLPIDMHHSSAAVQSPDQPFLREYKNNRKQKDNETETDEKKLMQRHFENKDYISSSYPHDGIEMKSLSFTNSVDLEVQEAPRYSKPTSITTTASIPAPLATHSSSNSAPVDRAIEYRSLSSQSFEQIKSYQQQHQQQFIEICPGSTINHNNNVVLANHALDFGHGQRKIETASVQLSHQYPAVNSVINNEKTAKTYPKVASLESVQAVISPAQSIAASSHQSASIVNAKDPNSKTQKKRNLKTNEKTIEVKSMQGYRGEEEVDVLLKYIEDGNGKHQKGHPKNGIVSGHQTSDHLLTAEEKKKKMAAKNKEKVNKLKKSNSMDELCSTGRHEQQQQQEKSAANKIIQDVTLRSKSSNLTSGAKKADKNDKSQHKRNERRSWGTEGLWTVEPDREIQDEQHEVETSSSSSSSGVPSEIVTETFTTFTAEPIAPIITETEFHVVTKKRKVKRKSNEGVELHKTSSNLQSYNIKRDGNGRSGTRNYNDRDPGSKAPRASKPLNQDGKSSSGKNRRKSTSSMPPSDDDWNSDGGDSVQSLPIETTKTTSSQLLSAASAVNETPSLGSKAKKSSNPPHQQKPATFSYADIAKTNANRNNGANVTASTEKWPSITSSSSTHQNSNNDPFSIANFDAVTNQKPQSHQQKPTPNIVSFPELVETNNVKNKQLSSHPSEIASNGEPINTTEKPSNGLDMPRPFDSNNNSNDDRANNNQKISYSQSLLENHQSEVDTNGNNTKDSRTLTKSKSVDQNNLSSIEHYPALEKAQVSLGEVFSPKTPVTFETFASKSKQKQAKPEVKSTKKDKLKKSASVQSGPNFSQQNLLHNCRPAVIILQDSAKPSDTDFGDITFGFDINEHLLHGQQNGDIRLEKTNNNDNCDIINTNLSNNNNQPNEMYEGFITPQNIIIGDSHIVMLNHHNVLDSSNQSTDVGYMSSSLITTGSPPAIQHDDEQSEPALEVSEIKRIIKLDGYQLKLPKFNSPEPAPNFNQQELISFVTDEWRKVLSDGVYFTGQ